MRPASHMGSENQPRPTEFMRRLLGAPMRLMKKFRHAASETAWIRMSMKVMPIIPLTLPFKPAEQNVNPPPALSPYKTMGRLSFSYS